MLYIMYYEYEIWGLNRDICDNAMYEHHFTTKYEPVENSITQ